MHRSSINNRYARSFSNGTFSACKVSSLHSSRFFLLLDLELLIGTEIRPILLLTFLLKSIYVGSKRALRCCSNERNKSRQNATYAIQSDATECNIKNMEYLLRLTNNRKRVNLSTYDLSQPNQRKKHNSVSDGIRPRLCNTMFYCNSNAVAW